MNRREFFRGAAAVAASPAVLSGGVAGFLLRQYGPPKPDLVTAWRTTVNIDDMAQVFHAGRIHQWRAIATIYGRDDLDEIHAAVCASGPEG